ncbi:MAG: hypothetical protein HN348_12105, partial [Proteobacteria bacterium]|nr:hypothetical protein [Pseudomonadota bacterium]
DCDDTDDEVHAGAVEVCNGIDDNCDEVIDDGLLITYYLDQDEDGYGAEDYSVEDCDGMPQGYAAQLGDCNDVEALVYPSAPETCDGLDNNCDDDIDEGHNKYQFLDADGDGWGDPYSVISHCELQAGYVWEWGDCDDEDFDTTTPITWFKDADSDGLGDAETYVVHCFKPDNSYVKNSNDCDDSDGAVGGMAVWYIDQDGDGYGQKGKGNKVKACDLPDGYSADKDDCDDLNADANPGAFELCLDSFDNDCDGEINEDDAIDAAFWFPDVDQDGFGDSMVEGNQSCLPPSGYMADNTDCDDSRNDVFPGGFEVCDNADNDCDGEVDVGAEDILYWYLDSDGDGFGVGDAVELCYRPWSNYVLVSGDCDDASVVSFPGASEICDSLDNDCDLAIDEDAIDVTQWYIDNDNDGIGAGVPVEACSIPADNYSTLNGDCEDEDATIGLCPESCLGCASSGDASSRSALLLLLMAVFAARRRQRHLASR